MVLLEAESRDMPRASMLDISVVLAVPDSGEVKRH